jgi:hypothetical protein
MTKMARLLALLWMCIVVVPHAQTPTEQRPGTIMGVVTDAAGDLVPGVTVTAMNATTMRSTVSNLTGEFVIAGVPPGRYLIEAALLGFRTTSRDAVEVVAGQTTQSDFVMRLEQPFDHRPHVQLSPSTLTAESAFVGHIRIRDALREAEFLNTQSVEWVAEVLSAVKGTQYVGSNRRLRFWQPMAGRTYLDGQAYDGAAPRHAPGEEFIAFFTAESGGALVEQHRYMTPVSGGVALWPQSELEGVQRRMPVAQFLDAIRRLLK